MSLLVGFVAGALFGTGLVIAHMTDPSRVLGFLDVINWDPRLAFVMLGAIAVHAPCVFWLRRRGRPTMAERIHWPEQTRIDSRLLVGAAVFGAGWGLAGYCPGPALTLAFSNVSALLLTLAMLLGILLHDGIMNRGRVQRPTSNEGAARPDDYQPSQGVSG